MFLPVAGDDSRRRGYGTRRYRGPAYLAVLAFRLAVLAFIVFVVIQFFRGH